MNPESIVFWILVGCICILLFLCLRERSTVLERLSVAPFREAATTEGTFTILTVGICSSFCIFIHHSYGHGCQLFFAPLILGAGAAEP